METFQGQVSPTKNLRESSSGAAATLCEKHVVAVESNQTVDLIARLMKEHRIGDVLVVEKRGAKSVPIGMITDRDLAIDIVARGESSDSLYASDVMTSNLATASMSDDVFTMIATMKKHKVGRLPVLDSEGGLMGIVTAKALLRYLVSEIDELIHISERNSKAEFSSH